jgi:hypothetical protein
MKTLIEKLRQYATGDDFQRATEQAADAIERLELEAVAATLRIENDKLEIAKLWATNERLAFSVTAANAQTEEFERKWYLVSDERDGLTALIDKALYALEYASDMTKPEDMSGCECPICTAIDDLKEALK